MKLQLVEKPSGAPEKWWPDLYLKKGRKLAQIQPEQCAALMEAYTQGRGSKIGSRPISLYDISGEKIGYISYNGRVWLHDIEADIEIPVEGRKTAAQRESEGLGRMKTIAPFDTIPLIKPTARAFCAILHDWLNAVELAQAIEMNKAEPDPTICHTHDFCDANEAMAEAIKTTTGIHPCETGGEGIGCMNDSMQELFNEAWETAKQAEFFAERIAL